MLNELPDSALEFRPGDRLALGGRIAPELHVGDQVERNVGDGYSTRDTWIGPYRVLRVAGRWVTIALPGRRGVTCKARHLRRCA